MTLRSAAAPGPLALFTGPVVWSIHFLAIYVFASVNCAKGTGGSGEINLFVLFATLLALVPLAAAAHANWVPLRRRRHDQPVHFLAVVGLGVTALSIIGVVWAALPAIFIAGCR